MFLILFLLFSPIFLNASDIRSSYTREVFIPHIATVYGWETNLVIDNSDKNSRDVEVVIYKNRVVIKDEVYIVEANSSVKIPILDGDCGKVILSGKNISARVSYHHTEEDGIAEFRLSPYLYRHLTFTMPHYLGYYLTWMGISVMNPNDESTLVQFSAYDKNGKVLDTKTLNLAPHSRYAAILTGMFDRIGERDEFISGQDPIYSYKRVAQISMDSYLPLCGINISGNNTRQLLFTMAVGTDPVPRKVYIPHIANIFDSWNNYLIFYNIGNSTTSGYITLYSNGTPVVENLSVEVPAHGSQIVDLNTFSDKNPDSGYVITSSNDLHVKIAYISNIGGTAEFELDGDASPEVVFTFPEYDSSTLDWNGIALFNPGENDTDLSLTAYKDGEVVGTSTLVLASHSRVAYMLTDIFQPYPDEGIDTVLVTSDYPVMGINISGAQLERLLFECGTPIKFFIDSDNYLYIPGATFVIDGNVYYDEVYVPENKLLGISLNGKTYLIFNDGKKEVILSDAESARAVAQGMLNLMTGGNLSKYKIPNRKSAYNIPPEVLGIGKEIDIENGPQIKDTYDYRLGTGIGVKEVGTNRYKFTNLLHRWALVERDENEHRFLAPQQVPGLGSLVTFTLEHFGYHPTDTSSVIYDYHDGGIKTYGSVVMLFVLAAPDPDFIPLIMAYMYLNEQIRNYWSMALSDQNIAVLNAIECGYFVIGAVPEILGIGGWEDCYVTFVDIVSSVLYSSSISFANSDSSELPALLVDTLADSIGDITSCLTQLVISCGIISAEAATPIIEALAIIGTLQFVGQTALSVWDTATNAPYENFDPASCVPEIGLSTDEVSSICTEGDKGYFGNFIVTNSGEGVLDFNVESDVPWATCHPSSGSVSSGGASEIRIEYDATNLIRGYYSGHVKVSSSNASNSPQNVSLSLQVNSAPIPVIGVSQQNIYASCQQGENPDPDSFRIWNAGLETLHYHISDDVNWLECSPSEGTSTGVSDTDTIQINYSTSNLQPGNYTGKITITDDNASNSPVIITVNLIVYENGNPAIVLSTHNISVSSAVGENAPPTTFTIRNGGTGTLNYVIGDDSNWLSCSPTSGSSTGEEDTITVTFSNSYMSSPGTYHAHISVTASNASNSPQTIDVTLTVHENQQTPLIELSTNSISVSCDEGENALPVTFTVRNGGTGTLSYTVSDNKTWMSCSPSSGTSTGESDTITVNFDTSNLSPGNYTGQITVSDPNASNSPQVIDVALTVNQGNTPEITVSQWNLNSSCFTGENASPDNFTISNSGGGVLNYTITTDENWLSCSPTNGSLSSGNSDTITVNYSTTNLNEGNYTGHITISSPNASNSPRVITVNLKVVNPSQVGTIMWHHKFWQGVSKPVVYNNSVYILVHGTNGSGGNEGDLFALDKDTGKVRWSKFFKETYFIDIAAGDGKVFFAAHSKIYALDAATGELKWQTGLIANTDVIAYGAIYSNGTVYALYVREDDSTYYLGALRSSDGSEKWHCHINENLSHYIALDQDTVYLYSAGNGKNLYAIDVGSGQLKWTKNLSNYIKAVKAFDDKVYVSTSPKIMCLNSENGNELWEYSGDHKSSLDIDPSTRTLFAGIFLQAFNCDTGELKWQNNDIRGTVVYSDGRLYVKDSNTVYVLNSNDGTFKWKYIFNSSISDIYPGTENFYTATSNTLYCIYYLSGGESLNLSTHSISRSIHRGQNASNASFTIENTTGTPINYSISTNNFNWISCSPSGGTIDANGSTTVNVHFSSSNLPIKTYNGTITVSYGNEFQTVDVSLYVDQNENSGTVKWYSYDPANKTSSPVVRDGVVYVADDDWKKIWAYDCNSGNELWETTHNYHVAQGSALAVDDNYVFLGGYRNSAAKVFAFNKSNGSLAWTKILASGTKSSPHIYAGTTLYNGKLFCGCEDTDENKRLFALDPFDGSEFWHSDGVGLYGLPDFYNGNVYIMAKGSSSNYLCAINSNNGYHIFTKEFQLHGNVDVVVSSSGKVYFSLSSGLKFYAVSAENGDVIWEYTVDVKSSSESKGGDKVSDPSPAVWNGRVYFIGRDGYIYCFNADTGDIYWKYNIHGGGTADWRGQSLVLDGVLYVVVNGNLYALDALSGTLVWKVFKVSWQTRRIGKSDNLLFTTDMGALFAIYK